MIGAPLSEDELAYITIHFASIMEPRRHVQSPRPNVLLVCDAGISTSNLLMARITSMYEVNVVDIVTLYDQLENALAQTPGGLYPFYGADQSRPGSRYSSQPF